MFAGSIGTQLGRIMERRQWEDERARLAAIVDSSYDAIIGKSLDGIIVSWNLGAEQTYGFTAEEAIGESIAIILPDGMQQEEDPIRRAVKSGRRLLQFEAKRRSKSGSDVVVSLTVSPIRDSKGRIVGSSTIERDITHRKHREQELEAAKAAAEAAREIAEAANRTKTEFLANISHELRTPMNAIIGMLELTLGEELSAGMKDYLHTARESAQTLLYLLDDLLDFSRMEAGRFELDAEPFMTREIVDGIVKTLSLRAYEKGLELAARSAPDVPNRLLGDGRRLRQVLMNLTGNAIKFTEQGEVLVSAGVESRTADEVVLLFSVKDTGIGIAPRDQKAIFAPFTQVDSSTTRKQTGSGLGLAICRELVDKMGGRIWLESSEHGGTTFYFTAHFLVLADPPTPAPDLARLRDLPILVVDDNHSNLTILRETLQKWDMNPITTADAANGLQRLRDARQRGEPFAVVIVDALMPEMDGFTLVEKMHEEGLTATVAVLMLSSVDRQTFQERCKDLAIDIFLEKPVSQPDLLDALVQAYCGPQPEPPPVQPFVRTLRPLRVLLAEDTPANQKVVRAMLERRGHHVVLADNGREALERLRQEDIDVVLM
ncbi:MAG: response regulator, partial [Planctomycetaceae bacterium]|nr:response regulator [Planctomycetaceae bacterium]